jgi:hypothetical protein
MTDTHELKYYFSMAVILITLGLLCILMYWMFWPVKTLEVLNNPVPVDKTSYKPGDTIYATVDYCKYTDKTAQVSVAFVDGIIYYMPTTTTNVENGCHKVVVKCAVVPDMPSGTYHIIVNVLYKVNPVREVSIPYWTQDFQIVNDN